MALSKAEKKRLKRLNAERAGRGLEPIVRTKTAAKKSAPAKLEPTPRIVAARPTDLHPIDKLLARHKINREEHQAATVMRVLCEKLERSGVDSSVALLTSGAGGSGLPWTDELRDAAHALKRIRCAISGWEYDILRKVCGEAWPIADAVHAHSICHRDGVLQMFRNCLKSLRDALPKADIAWRIHREASQYRGSAALDDA